jgi:DNA modification methylase
MNDLPYKEWMRFQKSFFWFTSEQDLLRECILFFTKSKWPDGTVSRTLTMGFEEFDSRSIPCPRLVIDSRGLASLREMVSNLEDRARSGEKYDFIMVNLQKVFNSETHLLQFIQKDSIGFFGAIRTLLTNQRYFGLLTSPLKNSCDFPIAWSIGSLGRSYCRLRDEKVGLDDELKQVCYVLFFQAEHERRPPTILSPQSVSLAQEKLQIPLWTIPKPPARRKSELVHPGKFPESLVSTFIEIFSKPKDTVFDPMVGTGSTMIAALRTGRNAVGVELNRRFIKIARERLLTESPTQLFEDSNRPQYRILEGDAIDLNGIPELQNAQFAYCVTSPPYWSVLRNKGSEYQRSRRMKRLPLFYSDDNRDLGNIEDYDTFLKTLSSVYRQVGEKLHPKGCLTVVVKNLKRNHILYTLAWDLFNELSSRSHMYDYLGTTLWCQDDIALKPFALGTHWVSNTLHQYCLHFRKKT